LPSNLHFIFPFITVFLFSCGKSDNPRVTHSFEHSIWTYSDKIRFQFDIEDTSLLYDLIFTITHSVDFPNQNIYTRIATSYPDQKTKVDTVSIELSTSSGLWFGRCNRKNCKLELALQKEIKFEIPGQYTVEMEQFTRNDSIYGIEQIDFKLLR